MMVTRGVPYSSDADEALQLASRHVSRYLGIPKLPPEPLLFTQQAVLDSLCVAPAPICKPWVTRSLASVSGLVRWVHETGQPLTRQHVFDSETRYRYIQRQMRANWTTSRDYEIRLELIAETLNGVSLFPLPRVITDVEEVDVAPLSRTEEADLWEWSRGLRPASRLHRVQGSLVLGLGVGLMRTDKYTVRGRDVFTDSAGVHVNATSERTGRPRRVTCRRDWEDRLLLLKERTPDSCFVISPKRDNWKSLGTVDEMLRLAQKSSPPAVFNNIRLRNTWLCRHLEAGTPLKVLKKAADLNDLNHPNSLLSLLPDVPAADVAAALRNV